MLVAYGTRINSEDRNQRKWQQVRGGDEERRIRKCGGQKDPILQGY